MSRRNLSVKKGESVETGEKDRGRKKDRVKGRELGLKEKGEQKTCSKKANDTFSLLNIYIRQDYVMQYARSPISEDFFVAIDGSLDGHRSTRIRKEKKNAG